MSSITPSFVFLSVALLFWSASVGLSSYLGQSFVRNHHLEESKKKKGEEAHDHEHDDKEHKHKESNSLLETVQAFSEELKADPKNKKALISLAAISLQAGVLDKALELYPRYLELEAEDKRARSDYALALIEAQKIDEAEDQLNLVLKQDAKFAPALMAFAYRFKVEGKLKEAKSYAIKAKDAVVDPAGKAAIAEFVTSLESPRVEDVDSQNFKVSQGDSPAKRITEYFSAHQIVGPKYKGVKWNGANMVNVLLENFPVENMPPFAKTQFENKIKAEFANFSEKIEIILVDSISGKELLRVSVGN
jgi:tetratricopeptide (TPR) repeat protein